MTSLCAIIPASNLQSANAALAAAGFGPGNFSVASFTGAIATHAALHAWNDPAFVAAVKAIAGVVTDEGTGDPVARTKALIEAQGAQWGANAPPLTGNVTAGKLYRHTDQSLWSVIQSYNADTYSDPTAIPALVRRAREPGKALPWVQPIDQYDSYKLVNPFTGKADTALHGGKTWRTKVDNNVWEPTAQSAEWEEIDEQGNVVVPPPNEYPAWKQPTGGHDAYKIGDKVTFEGKRYTSKINGNVWSPTAYPAGWQLVA